MRRADAGSIAIIALALTLQAASAETIYVSNEQDNTISVIDGQSLSLAATIPVGRRPRGIGLSADRQKLYVAVGDDNRIDVVDLKTQKVESSLPSGEDPELFVLHPDGRRLFVANENDNLVSVLDIPEKRIDQSKSRSAWSQRAWEQVPMAAS